MKTRLIFLVLLIVCFSCGTSNKPLSDAQKEKIQGEVKEVANKFIKGCEELNFDMVIEPLFDSPDFIYIGNGRTFSYKDVLGMNHVFDAILNQKITIMDEKYAVPDESTVIYTVNVKSIVNYKDGHSILADLELLQFIFKKIDGKWKVINYVDSYVEQTVKYKESSKELNQVELMKQVIGTWKGEFTNKDSFIIAEIKPFGNGGMEGNQKWFFKDKILFEQKFVSGYDKKSDKFIGSMVSNNNPEIFIFALWFTSKNIYERIPFEFIANPEQANSKGIYEFKSPDMFEVTFSAKDKPDRTYTWVRVK